MGQRSIDLGRAVAISCACGLVVASAGFGAVYAYKVGSQHSILLACLSVLFALALEGVKPLAIGACFDAFREWDVVRGAALLVLGLVAIAYSLTSELALMSGSKGDLTAERSKSADTQSIAKDRYQRAKQELASLKPSRTIAELEALVARSRPTDCAALNGTLRMVCRGGPSVELIAELGRAKRKLELENEIRRSTDAMAAAPAISQADPGAASLATYLSALGVTASVDIVSRWLSLVPVLALELGSALAMVLVASFDRKPVPTPVTQRIESGNRPILLAPATERDRVAQRLLSHIEASGGTVRGTHRGLAEAVGADRNTVARALGSLAASGAIALQTNKQGSVLKLLN